MSAGIRERKAVCFFPVSCDDRLLNWLLDEGRGDRERFKNASNSPNDDCACRRHRDLRVDGLPGDIDSGVLQAGKLRDGRLLVLVGPLKRMSVAAAALLRSSGPWRKFELRLRPGLQISPVCT
jgi:hypothetical protein